MAYTVTDLAKISQLKLLAEKIKDLYTTKATFKQLNDQVQGLVTVGGEANVLVGVKVNGTAVAIAEKMVDILIKTGSANGTISVMGANIAIKGLATLAYKSEISESELSTALKTVINAKAEQSTVDTLTGVVNTLIGTDTGKSARAIANEELAKQLIPANASDALNSLTEIATWIQSHPEDASAMNQAITDLTALVGTIPDDATSTNIVDYIAESVAKANTNLTDNYYTKSDIDGMTATDAEVTEMLNEVFS